MSQGRIKDCVLLKEITYYYQCGDFPCRLIRNLERSYNSRYKESPVENSEIVKGNGVFYFISWKHTPLDTPARNVAVLSHCTTRFARSTEKEHDKNVRPLYPIEAADDLHSEHPGCYPHPTQTTTNSMDREVSTVTINTQKQL